jgi:hypothetical protein
VINAPVRAPKARAHAERWVGSVRRECLDRLLILGRRQLQHVLAEYLVHYNEHRPHRALAQRPPTSALSLSAEQPVAEVISLNRVDRRGLLGGLITNTNSPHSGIGAAVPCPKRLLAVWSHARARVPVPSTELGKCANLVRDDA